MAERIQEWARPQPLDGIEDVLRGVLVDLFASGQLGGFGEISPQKVSTGVHSRPKPDVVQSGGKVYDRTTHPLLFKVIDALIDSPDMADLSARKLGAEIGVSKSWANVAKRYWQDEITN